MGRPSNRAERRAHIVAAFARVLADHGYAGATMVAVAQEAGVAPGLLHHHFRDKHDMLAALLDDLLARFRARVRFMEAEAGPLSAYVDGALKLDETADVVAARCWVSILSEAVRDPALFERIRKLVDVEVAAIRRRSENRLSSPQASAVLTFIIGALVVGAFAPRKTSGFAAPTLHELIRAFERGARSTR